jgi:uncharacterized protein YqfA (UPF0365 family)
MLQDIFNLRLILYIIIAIFILIALSNIAIWFQAKVSGLNVTLLEIIFMKFRKVPAKLIIENNIMAVKAGLELSTANLEAHYLSGGNVGRVTKALIAADKANIDLTFNKATAIDLAGENVLWAVETAVTPHETELEEFTVSTSDKYSVKLRGKIYLRVKIDKLIGGESEGKLKKDISSEITSMVTNISKIELTNKLEHIEEEICKSSVANKSKFELVGIKMIKE